MEEWKECRSSIGRFDIILVDLRKVGFGLLAIVLAAAAFLRPNELPPDARSIIGMLAVVMTVALFAYDRIHAGWLAKAIERAEKLEVGLGLRLTRDISSSCRPGLAVAAAHATYLSLLVLIYVIFGMTGPLPRQAIFGQALFGMAASAFVAIVARGVFEVGGWRIPP